MSPGCPGSSSSVTAPFSTTSGSFSMAITATSTPSMRVAATESGPLPISTLLTAVRAAMLITTSLPGLTPGASPSSRLVVCTATNARAPVLETATLVGDPPTGMLAT